jgi:hypothetical protein
MIKALSIFYRLPRLTALAMLIMMIGGIGAMFTLGRQEDPTLIERYGSVVAFLPGADAERMEALVTEPLEYRDPRRPDRDRGGQCLDTGPAKGGPGTGELSCGRDAA